MKRWLLVLTLPALLANAPSPLLVGSVRDQYGAPIAGAQVTSGNTSARTDAQGTFALNIANPQSVTVTCAYCRVVTLAVDPNEPVVALVHRYEAVAQEAPTNRDVAAVPYTHPENVAALRPFTVLENSSHVLPGPELSDRGIAPRGALLLDNGIPLYDVATNQSPFVVYPAYAVRQISWLPPSDAFLYGDLAGGGTLLVDSHAPDAYDSVASAGGTTGARISQTAGTAAWLAGISSDSNDTRMRADGTLQIPSGDDRFEIGAVASQDRLIPPSQHLYTSVNGLRAAYTRTRENRVEASFTADGGGYDGATPTLGYSAKWSDAQAQGGVTTSGRVQFFANAGARISSGYYRTSSVTLPSTSGAITQSRISIGAQTSGERYGVRLGAGAFTFQYSGGAAGARTVLDGGLVEPGFTGWYVFDPHWRLDVQAGESFTLPTILEAFVIPAESQHLVLDRNSFVTETLSFGDLRRFRAAVTAASERVNGLDNGTVNSAGISAAWQIAPALSLRAWLLRDDDETLPYEALYRFGARPHPATVGSYWATYETPGMRIDAIYQRDLLNYRVDPHVDVSISTPVGNGLRAFASTQERAGTRYVMFGVRVEPP